MFKPIHLDCYEAVKSYANEFLSEHWDFTNERILRLPLDSDAAGLLNSEFEQLGWPRIGMWSIFARGKGHSQVIHCDCAYDGTRVNNAIIIPVLGTAGSIFQWFDYDVNLTKILLPDGKSYYFRAEYDSEPPVVTEHEILEPIIASVRHPHRAVASNDLPRAVISIKLLNNPLLL